MATDGYYFLLLRIRQEDAVSSEGLETYKEEPLCWLKVGGEPLHVIAKMLCAKGLETYKEEPMYWQRVGGEPLHGMAKMLCVKGLEKWNEEPMCWRKVGGEPLHGMAKMLCAKGLETYKNQYAGGKREENHFIGTRKMQCARDRKDRRKNLRRKNHANEAWKLEV